MWRRSRPYQPWPMDYGPKDDGGVRTMPDRRERLLVVEPADEITPPRLAGWVDFAPACTR